MDYEDSSGESSSEGGEHLEAAEVLGVRIDIPQGITGNIDIFNEVFSASTWKSLNPSDQSHLIKYLPTFPENDIQEKSITLRRLFNRDNFKFGSPLETFHSKLRRGYFRPDIAQLHRLMKKAERRQYKDKRKGQCYKLLRSVILGRREVIESASNTSPGPLKLQRQYLSSNPAGDPVLQRVKKRYFQELAAVRSEVGEYSQSSEDENYADRAPRTLSKKQRQKLSMLENSLGSLDMRAVTSTLATKSSGFDLETHVTNISNPYEITDEAFKKMVTSHRRKRLSQDKHPNTYGVTLKDIAVRSQLGPRRQSAKSTPGGLSMEKAEKVKRKPSSTCSTPVPRIKTEPGISDLVDQHFSKKIKRELDSEISKKSEESTDDEVQRALERSEGEKNIDVESASPTNIPQNQKLIENQAQQFQQTVPASLPVPMTVPVPIQVPTLAPTPVLEQPVPVIAVPSPLTPATECIEEEEDTKFKHIRTSELMQDTHVCFFSLLRDIICSSPQHRMRLDNMESKLRAWETNPISPLNEWFSLVDESWSNLLDAALSFLSGDYPGELQPEDFVPYIEYKSTLRSYQWIGAGRDSDSHLLALCSHWLDHREDLAPPAPPPELELEDVDMDEVDEAEVVEDDAVPSSRCPTTWTVRASNEEEKNIFHKQERERFQNPTRAFTYRLHGYESVVGPVKGIYNSQVSSSVLKPRGHNLLSLNRPSYVTVLALVRDAAARLPNGEGTRADMCMLIRDSQYLDLNSAAESTLQGVVSGALDRLHYEVDACVRFDTKRKMWVYLHRRRSESEMEKMHQQYQGVSKSAKKPPRKKHSKKTDASGAAPKDGTEKPPRKSKASANMRQTPKGEIPEDAVVEAESLAKESPAGPGLTEPMTAKQDKRPIGHEIITSSGKKILIQTTFSGRAPVKFVTTPASAKLLSGSANKAVEVSQASLVKQAGPVESAQTTLLKPAPNALTTATTMLKPVPNALSTATTNVVKPGTSPFIMNNLAGTQFLTASGQKVQIIASAPQNIGQIQSIQLSNGQNILAQNIQAGPGGSGNSAAANILQNIQQVQILTSSGQIIARTIPGTAKTTMANLQARTVPQLPGGEDGKASVLKSSNAVRNTLTGIQMTSARNTGTSNLKNVRINVTTSAEARPTMSLLTSSQPRPMLEKDSDGKVKLTGLQMMQKAGAKLGPQMLSVSGVHLLNKPMMPKNNASVMTGIKLVSTQQGVKMVATSATTVVQTGIPSQKGAATVAKTLQVAGQVPTSTGMTQIQQMQRGNAQVISMDALMQGARSGNKGQASLIQFASSPGGPTQFTVVSQGSIGQPRIIQAQQLAGMTAVSQAQRTGSATMSGHGKPTFSGIRMGSNVTLAGMKPMIIAKGQNQPQNVILTTDGSGGSQALVLSAQTGIRAAAPGTMAMMQPGGTQQILLPTNFPGGTLNLKNLQGLKVIPISSSGQKVYARFVKNSQTQPMEAPKTDEQ